ncbi:MAG: hypothetical protein RL095_3739 [Verrucomicrobiota bacterium]|jgi:serine/threonine-protein kinase
MTQLHPGTVVAGYQIRRFIAAGNNGDVYEAVQLSLARPVALKILRPQIAEDPEFVRGFIREAQAAAAIQHPSIVQAYDVGRSAEGHLYFAMELVDGVDAGVLLKKRGRLPPGEAMMLIRAVAAGLAHGHRSRGLTHGDLKPSNLLIRSDGQVKLADLGLARMHGEGHGGDSDGICLTPHFAAPEVISGTWKPGDPRADMYSLGATLHCLISGEPPFDDGDYRQILTHHQFSPPPRLASLVPACSVAVSDFCQALLAKKPEQRFQNWEDLLGAADAVISGLTIKVKEPVKAPYKLASFAVGLAILATLLMTALLMTDQEKPAIAGAPAPDAAAASSVPSPADDDAARLSSAAAAAAEQARALEAIRQQLEEENQRKLAEMEAARIRTEEDARQKVAAAEAARQKAEAEAAKAKNQPATSPALRLNPEVQDAAAAAAKAKAREDAENLKAVAAEKARAEAALARKAALLKEFSPALELALGGNYSEALAKLKTGQGEAVLRRELSRVVASVRSLDEKLSAGLFKTREVHAPYRVVSNYYSSYDIYPERYDSRSRTWRCSWYDSSTRRTVNGPIYLSLRILSSEELGKLVADQDEPVKTFFFNRFGHYLPLQEDNELLWLVGQSQTVGYQLWQALGSNYEVLYKTVNNLYLSDREQPKGSAASHVISPFGATHQFAVLEVAGSRNEVWSKALGKSKRLLTKELSLCPDPREKDRARGLIIEVRPKGEGHELVTHGPAGEKIEAAISGNGTFEFNGWRIHERFTVNNEKLAAQIRSILVKGYQAK